MGSAHDESVWRRTFADISVDSTSPAPNLLSSQLHVPAAYIRPFHWQNPADQCAKPFGTARSVHHSLTRSCYWCKSLIITTLRRTQLLVATGLLSCALESVAFEAAPSFNLVALSSDSTLLLFKSDTPGQAMPVPIVGADAPLSGIDYRPSNKKVYGISLGGVLFSIDVVTGNATRVSKLSTQFRGGIESGFDFNPQSDRLRLVSVTGQNLRVKIEVGAVAIDGVLNYAPSDVHSGRRPAVTAAAYTNSVPSARSTLMFVIDHERDVLIRQDPPNDGALVTIGKLGINCKAAAGFDIVTDAGGMDRAFLVCGTTLYRVNLNSGAAQMIGNISSARSELISLAVLPQ